MKQLFFTLILAVVGTLWAANMVNAYGSYYQNQMNDSTTMKNMSLHTTPNWSMISINMPRKANITSGYWLLSLINDSNMLNYSGTSWATDVTWTNVWALTDANLTSFGYNNGALGTQTNFYPNYTVPQYNINFTILLSIKTHYNSSNVTIIPGCRTNPIQMHFMSERSAINQYKVKAACAYPNWSEYTVFDSGYSTEPAGNYIYETNLLYFNGVPSNISVDIGADGDKDYTNNTVWNGAGWVRFNYTAILELNNYLHSTCSADFATGFCDVPFNISSYTPGNLSLSNINISGDYFDPVGTCGSYYSNKVNFTFADESNTSKIIPSNVEYSISMLDGSGQTINNSVTGVTSTAFCILPGSYTADMILSYISSGYSSRFYFFDHDIIGDTNYNITLYLLDTGNTTAVDVSTFDYTGAVLSDAYVKFIRYYVGDNKYRTVAMIKTDDKGTGKVNLKTTDTWYKFNITKAGVLLRSLGPSLISSTPLLLSAMTGVVTTYYDYATRITGACSYSAGAKWLTCAYLDATGTASSSCLKLIQYNVANSSIIYLSCPTNSSWTAGINLSEADSYNRTVAWFIYTQNPVVMINSGSFELNQISFYGSVGIIATIIIFMISACMGLYNPSAAIVMGLVGVLASMMMGFLVTPVAALMSLIFVGVILIVRMRT